MDTASRKPLDWLIPACVNLTIPAMMVWKRSTGELSTTTALISGLVALILANVVAVVAVRSRSNRGGISASPAFAFGAAGLAVAAATVMAVGIAFVPARNEYADLAFSNIPLNQIHPKRKALVVELIRRKAANSREYSALASQMKPLSPALYSPESFANPDVIATTIDQLKTLTDADFAYYARQQEAEGEFRRKMNQVDPNYLKAMDAINADDATEKATVRLEERWFSATVALYNYAAAHRQGIATAGAKSEFNQSLENCKTLHDELLKRVQGSYSDNEKERARILIPPNPRPPSP